MIHIKKTKFKNLGRKIKRCYYLCLDFFGDKAFILLRALKLISRITPFSPQKVKRILIIRMDRIGDVLLSTPTFRAVRRHFPKAQIYLLVRSYTKDLVTGNSDIDQLIIFDDKMPFFKELVKYARDLKKKGFDLAIVLHPSFCSNFLAFASCAEYRIGYDAYGGGFFLTKKIADTKKDKLRHEVEVSLDVVRSIGIDTRDKRLVLNVSQEAEEFADEFLRKNNIDREAHLVAIHPGARYKYMRWLEEGFARVSSFLIERYAAKVIIIGESDEQDLGERIASLMNQRPIVIVGETSLVQLISLLKRCRLFIGNSSGPMHIAAALGIPVVAIFGNIHPADHYRHWGPWGEGQAIVTKNLNCLNCHPADCLSLDCMKLISPEDVMQAAEVQLHKKRAHRL